MGADLDWLTAPFSRYGLGAEVRRGGKYDPWDRVAVRASSMPVKADGVEEQRSM